MQNFSSLKSECITFNELQQRLGIDEARLLLIQAERRNGIVPELVSAWSYEDRWSNVLQIAANNEKSPSSCKN